MEIFWFLLLSCVSTWLIVSWTTRVRITLESGKAWLWLWLEMPFVFSFRLKSHPPCCFFHCVFYNIGVLTKRYMNPKLTRKSLTCRFRVPRWCWMKSLTMSSHYNVKWRWDFPWSSFVLYTYIYIYCTIASKDTAKMSTQNSLENE